MNGFEPLRRRIIDYTEAGQWSEVYDGPLEDCESEKLKAENAKLVMKLNAEHIVRQNMERENAKLRGQLEGIVGRSFRTADKMACLEAENDKLRQLVEDMLDCIEIRAAWHRPLTDEMCDEFAQRARELGVEI